MTSAGGDGSNCYFFRFGLIVTGEGEREHLTALFRPLMQSGLGHFEIIRQVGQRSPITSGKRKLKMVGEGKVIPDRDASLIGLPARRWLANGHCHFVILIDDLEHSRRDEEADVFKRYRLALDTMLTTEQQRHAAVFFLVNMLEAYYFADSEAVNRVLSLDPPLQDHEADVEDIRHPKSELKSLYPAFDEKEHGGQILAHLDAEHVLAQPNTCKSLRTLFGWCVRVLERHPNYQHCDLSDKFCLPNGVLNDVLRGQLDAL